MNHQVILVTGTNSGFGRLIALTLARKGHTVFATMRDVDGRNQSAASELRAIAKDEGKALHVLDMEVTSDDSVARAVSEVLARASHIDVVVNNAGFGMAGVAETVTSEQLLYQYNVNVIGPHRVARAVLPGMHARRQGLLIFMSSVIGRLVWPFFSPYGSSKFALEALAEAYAYELKPLGIDTTIVQPGLFPTDFGDRMVLGSDQERAAPYRDILPIFQQMHALVTGAKQDPNAQQSQEVADVVLDLIEKPAGTRPLRVLVDKLAPDGPLALNRAHEEVQRAMITGIGLKP